MHKLSKREDTLEYHELVANTHRFERLIKAFNSFRDGEFKYSLANKLLDYATAVGHCYWSSPSLEQYYASIAEKIDVPQSDVYVENTCLIVVTMAFEYGGMERVIERWVETDETWHYSIALTKLDALRCPKRIADDIKKSGGKVFGLGSVADLRQKAQQLRKLASGFETVVLMTYECDAVPLLAFGTERFRHPVGMYNQCDHRFGINVSISDLVGQLRDWGVRISEEHRGIKDSVIVSVPSEVCEIPFCPKVDARKALGFSCDAKIVLTVGRVDKYRPVAGMDFKDIASELLLRDENIEVIIVGPTEEEMSNWRTMTEKYGGRFRAVGLVEHEKLYKYYFAADVAIDSYPTGGIAASSDAIMCGCPILTVEETTDFLSEGGAVCGSEDELVRRVLELLNNAEQRTNLVESVRMAIERLCGKDTFMANRDKFMSMLRSRRHQVRPFITTPTDCILQDYYKVAIFHDWASMMQKELSPLLVRPMWIGILMFRVREFYKSYIPWMLAIYKAVRRRGLWGSVAYVYYKIRK